MKKSATFKTKTSDDGSTVTLTITENRSKYREFLNTDKSMTGHVCVSEETLEFSDCSRKVFLDFGFNLPYAIQSGADIKKSRVQYEKDYKELQKKIAKVKKAIELIELDSEDVHITHLKMLDVAEEYASSGQKVFFNKHYVD